MDTYGDIHCNHEWFGKLVSSGVQLFGKGKARKKMGTKGTTMEFFNLKEPRGANKYSQYTAVYC